MYPHPTSDCSRNRPPFGEYLAENSDRGQPCVVAGPEIDEGATPAQYSDSNASALGSWSLMHTRARNERARYAAAVSPGVIHPKDCNGTSRE
jgi:hypothetical protein